MKRWRGILSLTCLSATLGVAACASGVADDEEGETLDLDGKEDNGYRRPIGTFVYDEPGSYYEFTRFVFMSDSKFHADRESHCTTQPEWCPPARIDGTFAIKRINATNWIRLYDANRNLIEKIAYRVPADGFLELRPYHRSVFHRFKRPVWAWCENDAQCKVQNLGSEVPDHWRCSPHGSSFACK